jgi:hypothetical protein
MMGKNGKKMKKAQEGEELPLQGWHSDWEDYEGNLGEQIDPITQEQIKRGIPVVAGLPGSTSANVLPSVEVTGNRHTSKGKQEEYIPMERKPLYDPSTLKMFSAEMPDIKMASQQAQAVGEGIGEGGGGKFGDILKKYGPALLSTIAPFLRPSNANEDLPPDQLYPEYFALATNQLEPVQAQTFQPMLDTPYDISLNDQLNAIDSQSRAAIRAAGQNPAAQAMIMSQSLEAKNKVLGEQTRINQANKMQVYDKNRALLNDAQLKNLAILDQQYVRQAQARSNTKAQTQAALSSIAAKTAQQRASNRKLGVMENMYNFRFTPSGRAINTNAPAQFNMSGSSTGTSQSGITTDASGNTLYPIYNPKTGKVKGYSVAQGSSSGPSMDELDDAFQKNGGKTSKKKARNSSIVKALKNL